MIQWRFTLKKEIINHLEALRLERWPRSFAIYVGSFTFFLLYPKELQFGEKLFCSLFLSFFFTWLISTSNYIVNEIADAEFDRHHPVKRNRPLASGRVKKETLLIIFVIFVFIAFFGALKFFNFKFFLSLLSLFIAGIFYNIKPIRLKDIPYIDFTSESINNPIRFLIGWYAFTENFHPPLSILLWWWSFGMFLMIGKRISEKRFLGDENSSNYRPSLKNVSEKALRIIMGFIGVLSFILLFYFSNQHSIETLKIFSFVFLLFLLYFYYLVNKKIGELEEPEEILKNPFLSIILIVLTGIFFLSLFIEKFVK